MKFSRLELLDNHKYKEDIGELERLSIPKKIELGQFHITQHSVMTNSKEKIPNSRPLFMIFTKAPSPFVATLHDVGGKVSISIWDMLKNQMITSIRSDLDTCKVCLESSQNDRRFSMTLQQFSLLSDYDKDNQHLDFHKWVISLSSGPATDKMANRASLIIDLNIEREDGVSTSLDLMTTDKYHVVQVKRCVEWLVDKSCEFIVLDAVAQQPRVLKRISMPSLNSGIYFKVL